ncbi:glycosyltransferase [Cesiribacter sp. SM1]|uniref:glycosyltransferase n=1 Tax=Cesiribacter sp. SM1 TaxID=2861196 RepID=UPI001CD32A6E|nr:glycosyltransferase [Cesiribacter sp. SM1]
MMHKKKSKLLLPILILIGVGFLFLFLYGFTTVVEAGHPVLYILLTISLGFKIVRILFEWYHYAGIKQQPEQTCGSKKEWKVDMLTTACPGEPREMIEETLRAMVNVSYPHQNYLCDEGNDPALKALCQELGVHHVTRTTRENAKAGNINNALAQAKGEICVIMDPDHAPTADFLHKTLPYFDDPETGYVQVVQAYKNQNESLVARGAAEQTYNFYGPYMSAMGQYGTAQAIGANCTFRREALDSIGGHAPGLTEDMHTSMLLHAKGWKSVYVPEIVSRGLVPSTLSAYYKQQLKWSRGTFDLWFHVFPRLFTKLSWRQKLHYGLLPLYYLFGLVTLIDVAVPVYALFSGDYPWHMNPLIFFAYYAPLLISSLLIRLFAQRWLNEPHEKGLHLTGGILRVGAWWIYTTGFIYTLLNIKVPYIPTPKEHDAKNEFLLGFPNLLLAVLCLVSVIYGLHMDWQPYSFLMAGFALFNAFILFIAFAMGQTHWIDLLVRFSNRLKLRYLSLRWKLAVKPFGKVALHYYILLCPISLPLIALPWIFSEEKQEINASGVRSMIVQKEIGGFYTGIYPAASDKSIMEQLDKAESESNHSFSIVSTYLAWSAAPLPTAEWRKISAKGAIPMITWEPWTNLFPQYADHPDLSQNRKVFLYITEGYFDEYIDSVAVSIRSLGYPVFLRFAHEMDNPMYPWSASGSNTPNEFIAAWRYVHNRFQALGVQNVSWVWNPLKPSAFDNYYPNGARYPDNMYIDWIGVTCLNYGKANVSQQWSTFEEIYKPFQLKRQSYSIDLPVMLAEFGSTSYGGNGGKWVSDALNRIQDHYPEIKSTVLFYSKQDKNWVTDWRPTERETSIDWTYQLSLLEPVLSKFDLPAQYAFDNNVNTDAPKPKSRIAGKNGNYTMLVDGKPFYMKGICYNPQHDWQDGFLPLTRKQLENDFSQIKAMGANTIRRYEPGVYDVNMLNVAEETGLYIMYGFWFDPSVDYLKDNAKKAAYEAKVLKHVKKYKHRKSIIAWNIGNEAWGLQKKYFAKPYLTITRRAYLEFLEGLAQKIREIDPDRPIFASEEHEHYQLASTIYEMKAHLPSVDAIGINSYYKSNITTLQNTFLQFDQSRPYIVTEFGPKGYWHHEFGDYYNDTDSLLIEVSSLSKAQWYQSQWEDHIASQKGYNLGGFAFSWRDRYEGTATWFGITDYKGRLKPAYYYLQKAFKGIPDQQSASTTANFANITIAGPWYSFKPGETIWLTAGVTNNYSGSLSFEWEVQEESSWKNVTSIRNDFYDKKHVEIQLPNKKSQYRVYVHAVDSAGNVVTASRPLLME